MARKPLGIVLYEGPSVLDGAPIVVVATGFHRTNNPKTGAMLQTWILRADVAPIQAIRDGADASVCGACPLRATVPGTLKGRDCYVRMTGPEGVWKAWKRGAYADGSTMGASAFEALFSGRKLRMGAYGDPAAVPVIIWRYLSGIVMSWTGYTHQRSHVHFDVEILRYCMVSADTAAHVENLPEGARSFRVLRPSDTMRADEVYCPADAEKTRGRVTCASCGLCRGSSLRARNVAIAAHGAATGKELHSITS